MRKTTGLKTGRKPDITPEQEELLLKFSDRFRSGGDNGALYSEVAGHWIEEFNYGGLNPHNKEGITMADLRLDDDLAALEPEERLNVEEARRKAHRIIREKIGNWYRRHHQGRKENKNDVDKVVHDMLTIAKERPHKQTEFSKYTEMFYSSKLKPAFDTLWETCLQSGFDQKKRINYVKSFQTESLMKEPEELRASIRAACENEYQDALAEWKARTEWNGSAEDYKETLDNLGGVLPPMADAISKYTGMVAIVSLVGPCGDEKGNIIVTSVQSTSLDGKIRQSWAKADRKRYAAYQDALKDYGELYFSREERLQRVSRTNAEGEEIDLPTDLGQTATQSGTFGETAGGTGSSSVHRVGPSSRTPAAPSGSGTAPSAGSSEHQILSSGNSELPATGPIASGSSIVRQRAPRTMSLATHPVLGPSEAITSSSVWTDLLPPIPTVPPPAHLATQPQPELCTELATVPVILDHAIMPYEEGWENLDAFLVAQPAYDPSLDIVAPASPVDPRYQPLPTAPESQALAGPSSAPLNIELNNDCATPLDDNAAASTSTALLTAQLDNDSHVAEPSESSARLNHVDVSQLTKNAAPPNLSAAPETESRVANPSSAALNHDRPSQPVNNAAANPSAAPFNVQPDNESQVAGPSSALLNNGSTSQPVDNAAPNPTNLSMSPSNNISNAADLSSAAPLHVQPDIESQVAGPSSALPNNDSSQVASPSSAPLNSGSTSQPVDNAAPNPANLSTPPSDDISNAANPSSAAPLHVQSDVDNGSTSQLIDNAAPNPHHISTSPLGNISNMTGGSLSSSHNLPDSSSPLNTTHSLSSTLTTPDRELQSVDNKIVRAPKRKRKPSVSAENVIPLGPRVPVLPSRLQDNGFVPPQKRARQPPKPKSGAKSGESAKGKGKAKE